MRSFFITAILFFSMPVFAQQIDFVSFSKNLLNSESLRSPVYTKKLIRQAYQNDEKQYNKVYNQLDRQKKQDEISAKTYAIQTSNLKKIYETSHEKSLAELSGNITKYPIDSLYNFMMTNNRRYFLWVTTPAFQNKEDLFVGADIAQNLEITDDTQADDTLPTLGTATSAKSGIRKINKRKFGRKSYSIKLNAFE